MSALAFKTVEDNARGAVVTASGWLTHRCPHRDERDEGTVEITWRVTDRTLELHDVARYLREWAAEAVSHEALTDRILRDVTAAGVEAVEVVTGWKTGGLNVSVRSAPRDNRGDGASE